MLAPRREGEPFGPRAPLGQPRRFPGQWGAPPVGDPIPRWVTETRSRVPDAGLRPPQIAPAETFAYGPGAVLPPGPWEERPPAERLSVSALTGQEPSQAASLADVLAPPRAGLPDRLMASVPSGGPQSPAVNEPASAPNAGRRVDLDAEWNAAMARANAARRNKALRPRK